ncbi:MAG: sodium:proton antiporter [Aureispira sp.]|nr:sodium:proton antiporter [Aureispira sp.]
MLESFSILILISAIFSYINYRWLKLPNTIGLMLLGLLFTILLVASKDFVPGFYTFFCDIINHADFKSLLMDGLLSFLLFAGAIHVNIHALAKEKKSIILFSSLGVLISTAIVGGLTFGAAQLIGVNLPLIPAFLFGALISPTDPIAVISILKKAGVSESLEMKIEGESLFNDGVGVVVFSGVLLLLGTGHSPSSEESIGVAIGMLFLEEAVGGLLFGALIGFVSYHLIESVKENAQLVVILSLATAMGGYALATMFHFSGPLAMVVAGLIIGNKFNISSNKGITRKMFNGVWEILDETLNGVLFLLIGLAAHLLEFNGKYLLFGLISILIVLLSRFISVLIPFSLLKHKEHNRMKTVTLLTWGGLRGGISLALALSIPEELGGSNEIIFFITYTVVVFSIVFQGLSIGQLVQKLYPK